jgi:hypothetical protein
MDRRVSKCITIIPEQPGSTRARQARAWQVAALRIVLFVLFLAAAQSAAPAEIELQCSLTVDGRPAGEIPVLIDESENRLSAIGEAVLERAAPLARLPKHVNRQEWWTPDELQVLGLEAVFDVNALALELHIAEAVRVPERHRQGTRQTAQDATVHSELISGGINITANASAGREALYEDETDEVEAGVSFALDPFVNIDGWVLEGSLRADSRIPNAFPLVAARVVRDDMQRELRFEAGSLRYPVSGALTRVQMQGLAVYRLFANDGERSHIPDSVEFDVEKPTTVTLTLNGENIMTRYLYAGPHIVEDLPLTQGRNELVIADNGEQRVIPLPFDESLLARSHTDFSLSVGVLSDDFAAELDAEKHKPAASGFARLGITPAWTAGVYAHGDPDTVMGGIETVHATGAGVIRANASASKSGGAPGAKASLNWMTSAEDSAFAAALVSVSATTRKFATAGVLARDNRNWLETWGSAAFRIGKSASLTNSVRLRFAAGSIIPSFGASATGKVTVAPSVHVTATVRADVASTGQTAFGGMIAVGWVPTSAAGIRASASQDFKFACYRCRRFGKRRKKPERLQVEYVDPPRARSRSTMARQGEPEIRGIARNHAAEHCRRSGRRSRDSGMGCRCVRRNCHPVRRNFPGNRQTRQGQLCSVSHASRARLRGGRHKDRRPLERADGSVGNRRTFRHRIKQSPEDFVRRGLPSRRCGFRQSSSCGVSGIQKRIFDCAWY